jgi:glutathione S-transferase
MSQPDRLLYELVARDDRRMSPYCWRIRMALAHKGLEYETVPVKFTDKEKIAFANTKLVPVLVDFGEVVTDSWAIAKYLDENYYQERPLLLGGGTRFVNQWCDMQLHPALVRVLVKDIYDHVHPDDREYFRTSREQRFGKTIEEMHGERDKHEQELKRVLTVLRELVRGQPFVCGKAPAYADYIVFGAFQWARCISPFVFLDEADPIAGWRQRMCKLYGSLADSVPHYA